MITAARTCASAGLLADRRVPYRENTPCVALSSASRTARSSERQMIFEGELDRGLPQPPAIYGSWSSDCHIKGVVHDISEILEARRDFKVPKPILFSLLGMAIRLQQR